MLEYTGHPIFDIGVATICAFVEKKDPRTLTPSDLDKVSKYMQANYIVDPLKSFLTVVFPNSGYTQPAYENQPEKRRIYAMRILQSFRADTKITNENERCVFTGKSVAGIAFDVDGKLQPGRAFRQHIPLITGEGCINYYPYGDAGLPVSGKALLAIQAFPLGCAKVAGRLLAVHSNDQNIILSFASRFLTANRKAILTAQKAGHKKMPESLHNVTTMLIQSLSEIYDEDYRMTDERRQISLTAYHLSNSGQGVSLNIYHLPMEISDFIRVAMTPRYRQAWDALRARGWEIVQAKRTKEEIDRNREDPKPRYNVLYDDLFRLPEEAPRFIRRYFLRARELHSRTGDPRSAYSLKAEANLVSWDLTELFLRKVVHMNANRISTLRQLGDALAEYVISENDKRFFQIFLTARRYEDLRAAIIRVSVARMKNGKSPLVAFDPYIEAFEQGENLPYPDWRLAKDLILIRMIEQLYQLEWIQAHVEELPEPESVAEESA